MRSPGRAIARRVMTIKGGNAAAYAAFFRSLRLIRHSAIWTALSAAPLRRLSDTTHICRPCSTVGSLRMREMIGRVFAGRFDRRDVAAVFVLVDDEATRRFAQDGARCAAVIGFSNSTFTASRMADEHGHAHASDRDLDVGIENLLRLDHHLELFLRVAGIEEVADVRNHVVGDLLGEDASSRSGRRRTRRASGGTVRPSRPCPRPKRIDRWRRPRA